LSPSLIFPKKCPSASTALRQRETSVCLDHYLSCVFLSLSLWFKMMGHRFHLLQQCGIKSPPHLAHTLEYPRSWMMCEMGSSDCHIEHKTDKNSISSELLAPFQAEAEDLLSGLLQQMKPGSVILNRRQKAGQEMVPTGHTHLFLDCARL
jgi:hypothetical protein